MRIIALSTLVAFWGKHPETQASLEHWCNIAKAAPWSSMNEVQAAFPKAKVIDSARARFEIHGGNYRLIVAFNFSRRIAFVKFIGTHAEYDRIDARTSPSTKAFHGFAETPRAMIDGYLTNPERGRP